MKGKRSAAFHIPVILYYAMTETAFAQTSIRAKYMASTEKTVTMNVSARKSRASTSGGARPRTAGKADAASDVCMAKVVEWLAAQFLRMSPLGWSNVPGLVFKRRVSPSL